MTPTPIDLTDRERRIIAWVAAIGGAICGLIITGISLAVGA